MSNQYVKVGFLSKAPNRYNLKICHLDLFMQKWSKFSLKTIAELAKDCRVGLRWHVCCGCPISKLRPVLGFSSKNHGSFFKFFEKSKNELVRPKIVFLAILAKIR